MEKIAVIGVHHPCKENNYADEYIELLYIDENISTTLVQNKYVKYMLSTYLNSIQVEDVLNNLGEYHHGFKVVITDDTCIIYSATIKPGWIYGESIDNEHKVCSYYMLKYYEQVSAKLFVERKRPQKPINYINELKEKFTLNACDENPINVKDVIKSLNKKNLY